MKYLITGCSGFIGSNLAFRLAALGEDVWGIDSLFDSYNIGLRKDSNRRFQEIDIAFSLLDLAHENLGILAENWDYVIHCAGLPAHMSHHPESAFHNCNVLATKRLIETLEEWSNPTRLIYLSSSSVLGLCAKGDECCEPNPVSVYGKSKYEAEKLVSEANARGILQATTLRLFSVYGDREREDKLFPGLLSAIRWDHAFKLHRGSLDHVRDFIHVDDVCSAILKVIGNWEAARGEVFHIGTGCETIVETAIDQACSIFGERPRFKMVAAREDESRYSVARIAKAERLLGWAPTIALEDGLQRLKAFAKGGWY